MPDTENDVRFMVLWVAINSLYARWDNLRNTPHYDSDSRNAFLEMVYGWDQTTFNGLISAKRGLILKHLENPFLSGVFWRDPHHPDAKTHATEDARHLDNNFKNKSHLKVLKQAFDRLYVLRGQLMHGAATGGSKLNRKTLNYGVLLLMSVMPTILETTIDYGSHDDWHDLCYPPIST